MNRELDTLEFLEKLNREDIFIRVENGKIKCNAPEGALTLELQEEIKKRKQDILAFAQTFESQSKLPEIQGFATRKDLGEKFPLSFAQEQLWFLSKLNLSSNLTYNEVDIIELIGTLDIDALKKSLEKITERHEILGSTFEEEDGQVFQTIKCHQLSFSLIALENLNNQERDNRILQYATKEKQTPLDFLNGPLIKFTLLRFGQENHVLIAICHHILMDNWSQQIFNREWSLFYQSMVEGKSNYSLPSLPLQYAHYACWQKHCWEINLFTKGLEYWQEKLKCAPATIDLPRKKIIENSSPEGKTLTTTINAQTTEQLELLAKQFDSSLFMTLVSVFGVLLFRYSDQKDFVIGCPVAGRNIETESLIGMFTNTIVLRLDLAGNPPFYELLQRVQKLTLEAYLHQEVPFQKIVEKLHPVRNLGHNPLFQVRFAFQNLPYEEISLPGLMIDSLDYELNMPKFDLTLNIEPKDGQLKISWRYNTDVFEDFIIEQMGQHFQNLLFAAIQNSDKQIAELPMLSGEEEKKILDFNSTQTDYSRNKCIHQMFEEQVEREPEARALLYQKEELSYRDLNEKANQLADYLINLGLKREDKVVLYLERSMEMVISIFAVMKSGAVYVPLDSNSPQSRQEYIIADSRAKLLLTHQKLKRDWEITCPVLAVEEILASTQHSGENLQVEIFPDNNCYVIYTSGSTGKPKGAMISHGGLTNYTMHIAENYLTKKGSCPFFGSFGFDLMVTVLFPPLLKGNYIEIFPSEMSIDEIFPLFDQKSFALMKMTPTHLQVMEYFVQGQGIKFEVGSMLVGGEVFSPQQAAFVQEYLSPHKLVNHYGPTETVVGCLTYEVKKTVLDPLPIGKPMENKEVYIFDRFLQVVPVGVLGEIYIGGLGIARGYNNQPELSAEKFIPHPLSKKTGERIYKTGDLGRYLPSGDVEFLGRIDDQVKIRGFRVECKEIENCLCSHPLVTNATVLALEKKQEKKLVAFTAGEINDEAKLNTYLREHLPEYMIPSSIITLEFLPLNTNGKVDRRALEKKAESYSSERKREITLPLSAQEKILCQIWKDVLNIEELGTHDSFFSLGGHSILVIKMVHRVQQIMRKEIPIHLVFQYSTVAELSDYLKLENYETENIPRAWQKRYPLSLTQQRLWFLTKLEPENPSYSISSTKILEGKLDVDKLTEALNAILSRQDSLRTQFFEEEGVPYQEVIPFKSEDIQCLDLTEYDKSKRKEKTEEAIIQENQRVFNIGKAPLTLVKLFKWEEEKYIIFLNVHHIIIDGWSITIFWRELAFTYNALLEKRELLPPLSVQYSDYSLWQQKFLEHSLFKNQEKFWKGRFSDSIPTLDLPIDYPRPKVQQYSAETVSAVLDERLFEEVRALAQKNNATVFMVLLTAFHILLYRHSRQEDIVIGIPVANRDRQELENIIGFFVNNLALRVNLSSELSFTKALAEIRQTWTEAYQHRGYPFESLVRVLNPPRDTSRNPLFQVFFNMLDFEEEKDIWNGICASEYPYLSNFSKFDLTLYLEMKEEVELNFCYSDTLFRRETIVQMAENYQQLIKNIILSPHKRICQLEIFTNQEKKKILSLANNSKCNFKEERTIESMFLAQANKTPDDIVVVCASSVLTYRELNKQSNQLAHYLVKKGVKEEIMVGVALDNPLKTFVAILAIMKAGGAFVPLDPEHPEKRLQLMLEELQLSLLLTTEELAKKLFSEEKSKLICLDLEDESISKESPEDISKRRGEESLAYCIFTSGSTGKPKGVLVEHRHLKNGVLAAMKRYGMLAKADYAVLQPFTVDAGMTLYFPAILTGGTVHLFLRETLLDPRALREYFRHQKIDYMRIAPSHLMSLLNFSTEIRPKQVLILASEATYNQNLQEIFEKIEDCKIYNQYGATETSVGVLVHSVSKKDLQHEILPLGHPINNVEVYILDENLQIVPRGSAGEICIGGSQVVRGYLNSPELTKKKFVTSPFSEGNIYKTGDTGKYTVEGEIIFLGRKDDIVSIRGFNVACGEVEAILKKHSKIQKAIVLSKKNQDKENYLISYYVLKNPKEALSDNNIRESLREYLPDYMIPSWWVPMDKLPLTANGKVDRHALGLVKLIPKMNTHWEKPETEVEIKLTKIWEQVLNIENIGVYDNFFDLGGHSLLAIQVMAKIEQELREELPLIVLFESPTIKGLVKHIEQQGPITKPKKNLLPSRPHSLKKNPNDAVAPTSYKQKQIWLFQSFYPKNTNQIGSIVYNISQKTDLFSLKKNLNGAIDRHSYIQSHCLFFEGELLQVIAQSATETFWEERETPIVHKKINEWIEKEKLDYDLSSPFKVIVQNTESEKLLLIVFHQRAFDQETIRYFLELCQTCYQNLPLRKEQETPEHSRYKNYLQEQQNRNEEKSCQYWLEKSKNWTPFLEIPSDYPRTTKAVFQRAQEEKILSFELSSQIQDFCENKSIDVLTLFMGIFQIVLSEASGREDIIVATEFFSLKEELLGNYSNLVPLSSQVKRNISIEEFLSTLQKNIEEAKNHSDLSFLQLVEKIKPPRLSDRFPIAQFFCQYLDKTSYSFLEEAPLEFSLPVNPFDISLLISKEKENNWKLELLYNSNLFLSSRIQGLISRIEFILEKGFLNPKTPLSSFYEEDNREKRGPLVQGIEIDVSLLEDLLLEQDKIEEAGVLIRGEIEKELLLCLVLNPDFPEGILDLNKLQQKFSWPPIPTFFVKINQLPRKEDLVDKEKLQELLKSFTSEQLKQKTKTSEDPLQHTVLEIWKEILKQKTLNIEYDFFTLGGSSLEAAKMLEKINNTLSLDISLSEFIQSPTVQKLSTIIKKNHYTPQAITQVTSNPGRIPLFFFHGDFNGLGFYSIKLAQSLEPKRPFYTLCPHGIISREIPNSIEAMAIEYATLLEDYIDGPFYLGGFCNGAYVAWEVAQILAKRGKKAKKIFLIDPPKVERDYFLLYKGVSFLGNLFGFSEKKWKEFYLLYFKNSSHKKKKWTKKRFQRIDFFKNKEQLEEKEYRIYLTDSHSKTTATYFPSFLNIPVVLLFSEKIFGYLNKKEWQGLSPQIHIEKIPGNHLTAITWHLDDCRKILEKYLEE